MCGILGTTDLEVTVPKMNQALMEMLNRGPDNQDTMKTDRVWFGHTRLSILDLDERSNQPFVYNHKNRTIIVTFNGEIYNYLYIRKILLDKGYNFNTGSDTEVLCAAYCEFGVRCFDYFEGMWAVAINEGSSLVISRDRLGKKPLYYSHLTAKHLYFGSSLNSVAILAGQSRVSEEGIELYFALGFLPAHYSIVDNISKVEPGQVHQFEISESACNLINVTKSHFKPGDKVKQLSVNEVISASVKKRLLSDVPVTTLMSGGIDSTVVTSIVNKLKPDVEAYFVDFDDKKLSERKWAEYLAERNGINLNRFLMPPEALKSAFKDYYSVYEEPFADYSGIPSIAVFQEVAKKYKVVLTGDGGDELFYGYPHYFKKTILYCLLKIMKPLSLSRFLPSHVRQIVEGNELEFETNYLKNHAIITPFASSLINEKFNESIKISKSFFKGIIAYDRDFYNWPEKYLVKVDRSSMFSGVEVRSPFMDENLIKKVSDIPVFYLFTPLSSKLFLKLKYFTMFGLQYFSATKRGFTPPIEQLRNENFAENDFLELRQYLKESSPNVYSLISDIVFEKLKEDKILFDRFFFFNEWKKKSKLQNGVVVA